MGIAQKIKPIFAKNVLATAINYCPHMISVADLASCCKIFFTVDYWLIFDKSKASQGTIENANSRYYFCPTIHSTIFYQGIFKKQLWIISTTVVLEFKKDAKWATLHGLSKFDRSVVINLKPISYFFWCFYHLVFV